MNKKVFIFIAAMIVLIPLVSALTKIVVNETDLVNIKPKAEDPDSDMLEYAYS